jgi:hypothetical protein
MTPYELRFAIYQEARIHLVSEYDYNVKLLQHYEVNGHTRPADINLAYPSPEQIESFAKKIYSFVEQKQA